MCMLRFHPYIQNQQTLPEHHQHRKSEPPHASHFQASPMLFSLSSQTSPSLSLKATATTWLCLHSNLVLLGQLSLYAGWPGHFRFGDDPTAATTIMEPRANLSRGVHEWALTRQPSASAGVRDGCSFCRRGPVSCKRTGRWRESRSYHNSRMGSAVVGHRSISRATRELSIRQRRDRITRTRSA